MPSKKILVQEDFIHVGSGSNPASGYLAIYPKSDNNFYKRTSAGVEAKLLDSSDVSGTIGYVPKFLTANSLGDSPIYVSSSGNVGIGYVNPAYKLDVRGNAYIQKLTAIMAGEGFNDSGMLGILYDRNELTNAAYRGTSEILITGPGSYTNSQAGNNRMFNASGNFIGIDGLTQESIVIINVELPVLVENYSRAVWTPFFQTRLSPELTATYPREIKVEVSNDGIVWYSPPSGWYNSDFTINNLSGLWMAADGTPTVPANLPGWRWRFAKFTLSNFRVGSANGLWISQIGIRHVSAPTARQFVMATGDDIYGNLSISGTTTLNSVTKVGTSVIANLNADLLDGYHASSFSLSSHTHSYLPLAGGTISGNLSVNGNFYLPNLAQNTNANQVVVRDATTGLLHYRTDMLRQVALLSPVDGQSLIFDGTSWKNNNTIVSTNDGAYNTITLRSIESTFEFGNSEIYFNPEEGMHFTTNINQPGMHHHVIFNHNGAAFSSLAGVGDKMVTADANGILKAGGTVPTQYWQLNSNILSPLTSSNHLSINENAFFAGLGTFTYNDGATLALQGYRIHKTTELPTFLEASILAGTLTFRAFNSSGYGNVAGVLARATQDQSDINRGTQLEFWTTPNNTNTPLEAMIIRHDRKVIGNNGFGVFGAEGQSGTMTLITGCSYNSEIKTLIYTRVTATFNGGIITAITAASNLNVPL